MEGNLLGQTDTVANLKHTKKTNRSGGPSVGVRRTVERTRHLLSVVVGLKDVADGSAARRLQDEPEQPLVVLMRRTLKHSGERELQQDRGAEHTRSRYKRDRLRRSKPGERRSSYPEASDLCLRVNEPAKANAHISIPTLSQQQKIR